MKKMYKDLDLKITTICRSRRAPIPACWRVYAQATIRHDATTGVQNAAPATTTSTRRVQAYKARTMRYLSRYTRSYHIIRFIDIARRAGSQAMSSGCIIYLYQYAWQKLPTIVPSPVTDKYRQKQMYRPRDRPVAQKPPHTVYHHATHFRNNNNQRSTTMYVMYNSFHAEPENIIYNHNSMVCRGRHITTCLSPCHVHIFSICTMHVQERRKR